jgi:hypothetical protein
MGMPRWYSPPILLELMTNDISGTWEQIQGNCGYANVSWVVSAHVPFTPAGTWERMLSGS